VSTPDDRTMSWYVNGYHGGIRGHMPMGCIRDIVNALETYPEWKLDMELEPASYGYVERRDPQSYQWLKYYAEDQSITGRVEFVTAAWGEPFCWQIGGESNIRQLIVGAREIHKHFPSAVIDTYAVQEPCWTSCLPQVLRSLGFRRAVLKDPSTAFAGTTAGKNVDTLNWVGPDGTTIPAVPRYACEKGLDAWQTECRVPTVDFVRKCYSSGVNHPVGMQFEDAGWVARPRMLVERKNGPPVTYVTWREYIEKVADKPAYDWHFTQEDILVNLMFSTEVIRHLAQNCQAAENVLIQAEKMSALAWAAGGREYPAQRLEDAWKELMWAQHHDAWIVPGNHRSPGSWAWRAANQCRVVRESCAEILGDARVALASDGRAAPSRRQPQFIRVFNTVCAPRTGRVSLEVTADVSTRSMRVLDEQGRELPIEFAAFRSHEDKSVNAARIAFIASVPPLGYTTYRLESLAAGAPPARPGGGTPGASAGPSAKKLADGAVVIETDLYRIVLDPAKGGTIRSLVAKDLGGKEFVDTKSERRFNEFRGYFPGKSAWCSSADGPADVKIVEAGPLQVRVESAGRIGDLPYVSTLTAIQGQRVLDFSARLDFGKDRLRIGKPGGPVPANDPRKLFHEDKYKLLALFPVAVRDGVLNKSAAYDVCRTRHEDTFFDSWDTVKHNLILNWVDVTDGSGDFGLALFSDECTNYVYGKDHPLALSLAYAGPGLWQRDYYFEEPSTLRYALMPHRGSWDTARLWTENVKWNEPLIPQVMPGEPAKGDVARSYVTISPTGYDVSAMLADGAGLMIRLFNAEGNADERTVSLAFKPAKVELVELDGRPIKELPAKVTPDGRTEVRVAMPRLGLRTLRLTGGDVGRQR